MSFENYSDYDEQETKELNNLVILPVIEDEDIYVDMNENLSELWQSVKREKNKVIHIYR